MKKEKFELGATVWAVERDEEGEAIDVNGYVFLAQVLDMALVSPSIQGSSDPNDILAYLAAETVKNYAGEVSVYPLSDVYATADEAYTAMEKSDG